jgi:alkylhydroperoxidase family enzyme
MQQYVERSGGLNLLRMLAHVQPAIFDGFNQLSRALMQNPRLDPQLREIAVLRVGHLSGSEYEVYHHEAIGRGVGLTTAQLEAVRNGDAAGLTPAQQAVLRFTDSVVSQVRADDAALQALRAVVSDGEIVDLIMTIGCYMMVARLLATAGVEIDPLPLSVGEIAAKSG